MMYVFFVQQGMKQRSSADVSPPEKDVPTNLPSPPTKLANKVNKMAPSF